MNLKKAFTYMFCDNEFLKIFFIGCLFNCLAIFNFENKPMAIQVIYNLFLIFSTFMICGFWCHIIKNINSETKKILPNWFRDFKNILKLGVQYLIAFTIYASLVLLIVFCVLAISVFIDMGDQIILSIISACFFIGIFLILILSPAFLINFLKNCSFKAFFDIRQSINVIKLAPFCYLLMLVVCALLSILASVIMLLCTFVFKQIFPWGNTLGEIICVPLFFYNTLVSAHLVGQYAAKSTTVNIKNNNS